MRVEALGRLGREPLFVMKIVSWNVRGIESWKKRVSFNEFLGRIGPDIVYKLN